MKRKLFRKAAGKRGRKRAGEGGDPDWSSIEMKLVTCHVMSCTDTSALTIELPRKVGVYVFTDSPGCIDVSLLLYWRTALRTIGQETLQIG